MTKFALTMKRFIYLDMSLCKSTALIHSRHRKKILKGLQIPDQGIAEKLGLRPGQKLCVNCIKVIKLSTTEQEESTHGDEDYISSKLQCSPPNITVLNESVALLGICPIKSIGKRDRIMYGTRKAKKFKESVND